MIAFAFRFPTGRYHATPWGRHANEADVAWPPEPVRVLRTLLATWWRKADQERYPKPVLDALIDALAATPPVYHLPEGVHSHVRAYMPAPVDKKLIYDGFLRLERDAEVVCAWPEMDLSADQRGLVAHLLPRIGYLGRAESWAEGRIADDWDGEVNAYPRSSRLCTGQEVVSVDLAAAWSPEEWSDQRSRLLADLATVPKGKRARLEMTLPERLADALAIDTGQWQQAGWSSPPPLRQIVYDRPRVGPLPRVGVRKPRADRRQLGSPEAARFVLAGRPRPRIEETLRIAEIARWALIRGAAAETPVELLGRDENGPLREDPEHAHAFYLPEDADGDGLIDHLVVYCRTGFSDAARFRLDGLTQLWLAHGRADDDGERGRKEWRVALEDIAAPEAFFDSALMRPARIWQSVTPYLKPRFDKRSPASFEALVESYDQQIATEWQRRFPGMLAPEVSSLTDPDSPYRFATQLGTDGRRRSPLDFARTRGNRGGRQPDAAGGFFKLTFSQPVAGPIAIGWGCHFALGLFRADGEA
ncbi:MAG: type I-U CRISPR-associated protein Cas5/Cas6 [Rhodospirillales bacterium]|nr:type I-U CRISPR-associated protein Cas5/Cas6 [Rhodospirillales bacterium]